jgi:hypothetical protein
MTGLRSSQPSNTQQSAKFLLDYENWTIVPKKEKLLLLAAQFRDTGVVLEPVTKVRWFRRTDVLRTLRKLPSDHGLEAVTLMLADDAEDNAAYSLLLDLNKIAVKADFTMMSLIVPRLTTDQLLANLQLTSSTH